MYQDQGVSLQGFYTIPAGENFAERLAAALIAESGGAPEKLSRYLILLPTRRACRVLRDAFLRCSDGAPLLLPHLQPIGDIDEDELSLELTGTNLAKKLLDMPPAISPLRRQVLLSRIIMAMEGYTDSADQAFALAQALGRLMDQIYTEGLDIKDMAHLVPEDFAEHWQITLDFLSILMANWPDILAEQGVIDAADRRNRLIEILAAHWQDHPLDTPVIAAGSTGSIPATATLLKTVAAMPQGAVVLPGLDQYMDEESGQMLDETHPQATLFNLLRRIGIMPHDVKSLPVGSGSAAATIYEARRRLATELMRPAATTQVWTRLSQTLSSEDKKAWEATLEGVERYECDTAQEEAQLIAFILRQTLEKEGRTAALITPDRNLARRVAAVCRRWGIVLDDSGGRPLPSTTIGSFLQLTLEVCENSLSPAALAALLKHGLFRVGLSSRKKQDLTSRLEKKALRGSKPPPGIEGLKARLQDDEPAQGFVEKIDKALAPLLVFCPAGKSTYPFKDLLEAHIKTVEALSCKEENPSAYETVWRGDDGEAAAVFLSELRDLSPMMPDVTLSQYKMILRGMMDTVTVRPSYGTHPRLFILGQLEARLLQADLVIMGGLNEGSWPPDPGHDPWMSRPMRKSFGLPAPERSVGLSAHDFVQGFCAPHVVMTRSRRVDGTPTVPSRWLQRLDTVLHALDIRPEILETAPLFSYMAAIDRQDKTIPWPRPAPCPPREARPHSLYVTQIEKWIRDPYSLYAQKILNLKKLPPLEDSPDAAIRGTIVHDVLHHFISAHKNRIPDNVVEEILASGRAALIKESVPREAVEFWWPRFERLAVWFAEHEIAWRIDGARPLLTEGEGTMVLSGQDGRSYVVKAKADRIDRLADGGLALIDYKTGGVPKKTEIEKGVAVQMPLEAAIALDKNGGFVGVRADKIGYIGFWTLSGGATPGEEKTPLGGDPAVLMDVAATAKEGALNLFAAFDNDHTPYPSLPRAEYAPPKAYQDYSHLARVEEWADLDDQEDVL